mmetsp:Transcript_43393/g.106154  ORF Transcript_43393/g.106154 Transcript_43393/m.106154 type:complete len:222 (+) Transcript_43393:191-856(+)
MLCAACKALRRRHVVTPSVVDRLDVEPHAVDRVGDFEEVVLGDVDHLGQLGRRLAQLCADDVVLHNPVELRVVHLRDPLHEFPEPRHVVGSLIEYCLVDVDDGGVGEIDTRLCCELLQRRVHGIQVHLQVVLRLEHSRVDTPDSSAQHHHARVPKLHELLEGLPSLPFLIPQHRQPVPHVRIVVHLPRQRGPPEFRLLHWRACYTEHVDRSTPVLEPLLPP